MGNDAHRPKPTPLTAQPPRGEQLNFSANAVPPIRPPARVNESANAVPPVRRPPAKPPQGAGGK